MDKPIRFPVTIEHDLNEEINTIVFMTKTPSKHEFILNAIKEKVDREMEGLQHGKALQRR